MTHQATSNDDEPLIRQLPLRLATLRIVCKGGRTTSRTDDQLIRLLPLRLDYQQAVSLSGLATSWLLPMMTNHSSGNSHCGWPHNKLLPGLRLNTLAQATEPALPSALLKLLLPGLGRHIVCTPGDCIALCQPTNLSPPQVSSQCAKAKS